MGKTSTPPLPMTPELPSLKPLESTSPAGAFVSVFTPTDQSAEPQTEEVDINGIKVGAWSSELKPSSCRALLRSPYFWMVSCCPCVPVAQLEVRLGWTSYRRALLRHAFAYAVFVSFIVANCVQLVRVFKGEPALCAQIFLFVCLVATAVLVSRRIGQMRSEVRARFQIDGSEKDDQCVALLQTSRAIRQLGRHLQCDRAVFSRAPTTLQAYQV